MNIEHPKAVAAKQEAEQRKQHRAEMKQQVAASRAHGVKYLAVGIYTICYRVDRRNLMEISTTICHPNDRPDKLLGQYSALGRFVSNNRILLRIPSGVTPTEFLRAHFGLMQLD